jgi:hypothetical protein
MTFRQDTSGRYLCQNILQSIETKEMDWQLSWAAVLLPRSVLKLGCGAHIYDTTQIVFNDAHGKNFVSKADYTNRGPKAIIEMSPSLL